jgi:hypothetical protein
MVCSDPLLLQRFFDDELDPSQADVLADHLHACDGCRSEAARTVSLRTFAQDQLGAEDEGEEEATAQALAAIRARVLAQETARPRLLGRWWRDTWLAAAAVLVLALTIPISFLPILVASPGEILEESEERGRAWMYQPEKNLHWQVDTVAQGIKGVRDGSWRTFFWRSNAKTSFAEISRQIDPAGRTEFVYWQRHDGSSINYHARTGRVEVSPSTSAAREALPSLDPTLRDALQAHLTARSLRSSLDVNRRRDRERVHGRKIWVSGGEPVFSRGFLDRFGSTRRITVTKDNPMPNAVRAVHEYDIDGDTLRLLRLKTTITYVDGTTGVHDARWVLFREIPASEFAAQQPNEIFKRGFPVVHLTPRDLAQRMITSKNRSNTTE